MGCTSFMSYSMNFVDPKNSDWYSAQIDLNDPLLRRDSVSNDLAIALFIHEMGHAFGLDDEYTNMDSIMFWAVDASHARRVQRVDNDALNTMY